MTDTKVLLSTLDSIVKNTEGVIRKQYENISPDQAKQFAEAMKQAEVSDKVKHVKVEMEKLSKILNQK